MQLVIYGDFNCPFCALASSRVARLERGGAVTVDWRAVVRLPEIPARGERVGDAMAKAYAAEIEQVRGLLLTDETLNLRIPTVRVNTAAATAAYAATGTRSRSEARIKLFHCYWDEGRNLGDPSVLETMGLDSSAPATAAEWRDEWLAFDRPMVPMMRLPDGSVSRGLAALARIGDLITDAAA